MNQTLQIVITETPDGDYLATCGGMKAEGATPAEAERLLRELLQLRFESHPFARREAVQSNPDDIEEGDL